MRTPWTSFLVLLALAMLPAGLSAQEPARAFVRLVSAYRLRQFQRDPGAPAPSASIFDGASPSTVDLRILEPRPRANLSRRIQLPFPGPLELSLYGRLSPFGPSSSLRLRFPIRFGLSP